MSSILLIVLGFVAFVAIAALVVFVSMKSRAAKIVCSCILPLAACALLWFCVQSIMKPLNFQKEQEARKAVAVQRLKDIRTLEVGFKSVYGKYTADIDSLKLFYNQGQIEVVRQIGSQDDSVAVANTEAIKKKFRNLKKEQLNAMLLQMYEEGVNVVLPPMLTKVPVRDTLCKREDFCIDSIAFIPCCGDSVKMDAIVKTVSGVKVPLFEAKMPYGEKVALEALETVDKKTGQKMREERYYIKEYLLRGMDHQLVVNLCTELIDTDRYPGLMVGSVSAPNNNAGNWE